MPPLPDLDLTPATREDLARLEARMRYRLINVTTALGVCLALLACGVGLALMVLSSHTHPLF